eukprot:6145189-Pyramimonas_sp.AAC.1
MWRSFGVAVASPAFMITAGFVRLVSHYSDIKMSTESSNASHTDYQVACDKFTSVPAHFFAWRRPDGCDM